MSANSSSNEMIAFFLSVLEGVESTGDQPPVSAVQKPAAGSEEIKSRSVSTTENREANPLVERIAAAISKLRNRAPAKGIG
jgi:hypothetical protein